MIAGLYRRYAPELVRYIRKYTEDQAAAEDIVQETFVRGMEHGSQLEVLEESPGLAVSDGKKYLH